MAKLNFGGVIEEVMTREEFPLEKAREVLKDETIDAVHLVTPIPLHADQSVAVLESGKHCACTVPMATSLEDIRRIESAYPNLAGIMIGRGLLARPSLAQEYASGKEQSWTERRKPLLEMHQRMMEHYQQTMNSESQLHNKLRTFWEYTEPLIGRKPYKKIMKSGNLRNYMSAIEELR